MSRAVVTGGAGFIGSHVVDLLVARGYDVVVVDSLHPAAHDGPPTYRNDAATYRFHDVRDTAALLDVVDGADAVCHHAAMVGLGVDFADVCDYVGCNDGGTAALLWALHRTGFAGHLVLASSMVVYGEGRYACPAHGVVRPAPRAPEALDAGRYDPACVHCGAPLEARPVPEDAPLDPRSVYAATKLQQEHLCRAFASAHPACALTVLRYHNVYGPRMPADTPYAGVAAIFRSALAAGRSPQVTEDGAQRRDFVHVADVARANLLALDGTVPGTFNVASGDPRSVLDMAQVLAAATGGPAPQITGAWRPGDVRHVFASADLAAAELGFVAEVGFEEGMAAFAQEPLRFTAATIR